MDNRYDLYVKIVKRAEKEGLSSKNRRVHALMDIESADRCFSLDLESFLESDGENFCHDFLGIRENADRSKFPASFGCFVPRFTGKSPAVAQ